MAGSLLHDYSNLNSWFCVTGLLAFVPVRKGLVMKLKLICGVLTLVAAIGAQGFLPRTAYG